MPVPRALHLAIKLLVVGELGQRLRAIDIMLRLINTPAYRSRTTNEHRALALGLTQLFVHEPHPVQRLPRPAQTVRPTCVLSQTC
jgi:hypothetical protein